MMADAAVTGKPKAVRCDKYSMRHCGARGTITRHFLSATTAVFRKDVYVDTYYDVRTSVLADDDRTSKKTQPI